MANNKKAPSKKSKPLNARWIQNAMKSIGSASAANFKSIAPTVYDVTTTAMSAGRSAAQSLRNGRSSIERVKKSLESNKTIGAVKEAVNQSVEDLKSGNLYNEGRMGEKLAASMGFDDFDNFDDEPEVGFDSMDDEDYGYGNDGSIMIAEAVQSGNQAIVRGQRASVEAMISLTSSSMMMNQQHMERIISVTENIDNTLTALLEYNQENTTSFYEAMTAAVERLGERLAPDDNDASLGGSDDATSLFNANGGINIDKYKQYVKGNMKKAVEESPVGMLLPFLKDDEMISAIIADPVGGITKGVIGALLPKVVAKTLDEVESTFKDFIPNALNRMANWANEEGAPWFKRMLGAMFGMKMTDENNLGIEDKVTKDAATFDKVTRNSIIEVLPKYARESTSYLKAIAEKVTGKPGSELLAGAEIFDARTNSYKTQAELQKEFAESLKEAMTDSYNNSDFGKALKAAGSDYQGKSKEKYDSLVDELFVQLSRSGQMKGRNGKGIGVEDLNLDDENSLINTILGRMSDKGNSKQRKTLEEALRYMRENNLDGSITTATNRSRSAWNRQLADVTKDYDMYNLHAMGLNSKTDMRRWVMDQLGYKNVGKAEDKEKADEERESAKNQAELDRESRKEYDARFKSGKNVALHGLKAYEEGKALDAQSRIRDYGKINTDQIVGGAGESFERMGQHLVGSMHAIMAGDSVGGMKELSAIFTDSLKTMWDSVKESVFKPLADSLFGQKNSEGYIKGGIFEGVQNRTKDTWKAFVQRINGKDYVDSNGETQVLEEGQESLVDKLGNITRDLRDSIKVRLFGDKSKEEGENGKKDRGIIGSFTDSVKAGFDGWREMLFGKRKEDEDPEAERKSILQKLIDHTPDAAVGTAGGALFGALAGGSTGSLLGAMIGGPVGGAVLGFAGSFLAKSDKFKDWLFGPEIEDENGGMKRVGGFISAKTQEMFKNNAKMIVGGAALGAIRSIVMPSSGGLLASLVGGPLAGAVLGAGVGVLKNSTMFNEFLYGNPEKGKTGVINAFKGIFKKGSDSTTDGEKKGNALKMLGMAGVGAAGSALSAAMIGKVGLLGAMVTPGGPIGAAVVGAAVGIASQSDRFKSWLFGEEDEETGQRKGGVIGKFSNYLKVEVMEPMKSKVANIFDDVKTTIQYDILENVRLPFVLVANTIRDKFDGLGNMIKGAASEAKDFFVDMGKAIIEPISEAAKEIFEPVRAVASKVTDILYNSTKMVLTAPFKLVGHVAKKITDPISKGLRKIGKFAIKGVGLVTKTAMKGVTSLFSAITKTVMFPFKVVGKGIGAIINVGKWAARKIDPEGATAFGAKVNKAKAKVNGFVGKISDKFTDSRWREEYFNSKAERAQAIKDNRDARRKRDDLTYNRRMMAKVLDYRESDFTRENFEEAKRVAKEKGIKIRWKGDLKHASDDDLSMFDLDKKALLKKPTAEILNDAERSDDPQIRSLGIQHKMLTALEKIRDLFTHTDEMVTDIESATPDNGGANEDNEPKFGEANQRSIDDLANIFRSQGFEPDIADEMARANILGDDYNREATIEEPRRDKKKGLFSKLRDKIKSKFNPEEVREEVREDAESQGAAHAKGGNVKGGEPVLVGDGGSSLDAAEVFVPKSDGKILSQGKTGLRVEVVGVAKNVTSSLVNIINNGSNKISDGINKITSAFSGGKGEGAGILNDTNGNDATIEESKTNTVFTDDGEVMHLNDSDAEALEKEKERKKDEEAAATLDEDQSAEEKAAREEGSYKNLEAKKKEAAELEDNRNTQHGILAALQNLGKGNQEHQSLWKSIFSKKGLIGLLLLKALPLINKFLPKLTALGEMKDSIVNFAADVSANVGAAVSELWSKGKDVVTDIYNKAKDTAIDLFNIGKDKTVGQSQWVDENGALEDGHDTAAQIEENVEDMTKVLRDIGNGKISPAVWDFIMDEDTYDAQSGGRMKLGAQYAGKKIEAASNINHKIFDPIKNWARGKSTKYDVKAMEAAFIKAGFKPEDAKTKAQEAVTLQGKMDKITKAFEQSGLSPEDSRKKAEEVLKKVQETKDASIADQAADDLVKNANDVLTSTVDDATEVGGKKQGKIKSFIDKFFKKSNPEEVTALSEELAETAAKGTDNVAGATLEGVEKSVSTDDSIKSLANMFMMQDYTEEEAMRLAAGNVTGNEEDGIKLLKKLRGSGATLVDDAAEAGVKSIDDIARAGSKTATKLATETVGDVAEAGAAKGAKGVYNIVEKAFKAICSKVKPSQGTKLFGKMGGILKTVSSALSKGFSKIASKVAKALEKGAAALGTAGLSTAIFCTVGALNGLSGAARLFYVDSSKVDTTMTLISGAIGAVLIGTTPGTIIDIVCGLVADIKGIDLLNTFACMIYRLLAGEDNYEKLDAAANEFKTQYTEEKDASIEEQYKTQLAAGIIDSNVTLDDFKSGVKEGKYKVKTQSFVDYNAEQHQTMGYKAGKVVEKVGRGIKTWYNGESAFTDDKGNIYFNNGDGSYRVMSSMGEELGIVSGDAIDTSTMKEHHKKGMREKVIDPVKKGISNWWNDEEYFVDEKGNSYVENEDGTWMVRDKTGKIIHSNLAADKFDSTGKEKQVSKKGAKTKLKETVGSIKDTISNTTKKIGQGVSNWWKGDQVFYDPETGNTYTDNGNDQYIISDANGNTLGVVWKDEVDTSKFEQQGKKGAGTAFKDAAKIVGKGIKKVGTTIGSIVGNVFNAGLALGKGIAKIVSNYTNPDVDAKAYFADKIVDLEEENPFHGLVSGILGIGKVVGYPIMMVAETAGKVGGAVIGTVGKVAKGIAQFVQSSAQIVDNFYNPDVDFFGYFKADVNKVDEDNPLHGLFGAMLGAEKFMMFPVLFVRGITRNIGKKIGEGIGHFVENLGPAITDLQTNTSSIWSNVFSGDPAALASLDIQISEDNPIGGIMKGLFTINKFTAIPLAGVSWLARKIGSGIHSVVSNAGTIFTDMGNNTSQIADLALSGEPGAVFSFEPTYAENNPLAGVGRGLTAISKLFWVPVSGISWVGHKIGNGISTVVNTVSTSFMDGLNNTIEIGKLALSGDPGSVIDFEAEFSDDNPLAGIQKGAFGFSKLFWVPVSAISWVGHKIGTGISNIVSSFSSIYSEFSENEAKISEAAKSGDITTLSGVDIAVDPDVPLSGFVSGILNVSKYAHYPVAYMHKAFNAIGEKIRGMLGLEEGDFSSYISKLNEYSDIEKKPSMDGFGDITLGSGNNPVTGIIGNITKVVMGPVVMIRRAISKIVKWVKDKVSWITDGVKGLADSVSETVGDTVENVKQGASNLANNAKNAVSGAWSSFTSGVNNIGTAAMNLARGGSGEGIGNNTTNTTNNNVTNNYYSYGGSGEGKDGFTYYSQKDGKWGSNSYGNDGATIADTGCGPTAMAMVASNIGASRTITPDVMAKYAEENGFRDDTGTNAGFISNAASAYGMRHMDVENPTGEDLRNLAENGPTVVNGISRDSGPYTQSGHYIVLSGTDDDGNIIVKDPRGKDRNKAYDADKLASMSRMAWSFGGSGRRRNSSKKKRSFGGRGENLFTAADVINIGLNEVGYLEKRSASDLYSKTGNAGKNNHTKYEKEVFGSTGNYWCASFVSWCFYTAANKDKEKAKKVLGTLSMACNTIMDVQKRAGRFSQTPQPGDCIYFKGSRHAGANHIGIVVKVEGGRVHTVEGNTSAGSGVVDNGGGVATKSYALGDGKILGYGHPSFDGSSTFTGVTSGDATVTTTTSSGMQQLDTMAAVTNAITGIASQYASNALKGTMTGNWDDLKFTDPNATSGSTTSASTSVDTSSYSSGQTYPVVNASDAKLSSLANGNTFISADIKTLPHPSANQIEKSIRANFAVKDPGVFKAANAANDANGLYKAQEDTGLSAIVPMAIGALESGWGSSSIARGKGNLWGWGAVNSNPYGGAKSFNPNDMGSSFGLYSQALLKKYYDDYGAKSIHAIGSGDNPKKMGYAYHNNGTIDASWVTQVGSTGKRIIKAMGGSGEGISIDKRRRCSIDQPFIHERFGGSGTRTYDFKRTSNTTGYVGPRNATTIINQYGGNGPSAVDTITSDELKKLLNTAIEVLRSINSNTESIKDIKLPGNNTTIVTQKNNQSTTKQKPVSKSALTAQRIARG